MLMSYKSVVNHSFAAYIQSKKRTLLRNITDIVQPTAYAASTRKGVHRYRSLVQNVKHGKGANDGATRASILAQFAPCGNLYTAKLKGSYSALIFDKPALDQCIN